LSSEPLCIAKLDNLLGEGPCWAEASGRLYWFDIKGLRLHWLDHASGEVSSSALPYRCSAAAPRASGGLILATEKGICAWDDGALTLSVLQPIVSPPGFRSNDGKIDVAGRFWWSMMDDEAVRPGFIGCYEAAGRCERMIEGVTIPNTLACSPDGRVFYYADSALNALFACELDPASGALLSAPREVAHTRGQPGGPDGSAVDEEGFIWNAQWGLSRVVRYAPDGRVDRIVPMPVEQPSSCAFGGPDLDILYVTSATEGLAQERLARRPLSGALFALRPAVRGLRLPAFGG
jgi:sugar lactone lactonase YvrE